MNISEVIAWKFNNQEGMRCDEIDGVLTITEFPDGVPSQALQDAWTTEYEAHLMTNPPEPVMTVEELYGMLKRLNVVKPTDRII